MDDWDYEVVELSEQGMRIVYPSGYNFDLNKPICGIVQFQSGESIPVKGFFLRLEEEEMVLKLLEGPNLKRMMGEQINIRKKHPMFFDV